MSQSLRLWCIAVGFATLAACSKPAGDPYTRVHVDTDSSPCLVWSDRAFTYHLDAAGSARTPGDTERAAVDAAFATWQAVSDGCSDFHFAAGTDVSTQRQIVWREQRCDTVAAANDPCFLDGTCPAKYGCWDDDAQTLAVTTVSYSRSTGILSDADIQLNGAGWLFTTVTSPVCPKDSPAVDCVATDVQNTLTHEIGHALGFGHVSGAESTMAATSPAGELSKRVIDEGTAAGFCAVYPKAAAAVGCMP